MARTISLAASTLVALMLALTGCAGRTAGESVDDATITTKVKAAFAQSKIVDAVDIDIETYRGNVQLSGYVDSQAQIDRAGEIAAGIRGVRSVDNDLQLKQDVSQRP